MATEHGAETRLVDIDRDLLLIPNLAIHMNRAANDGYKWDLKSDTMPLFAGADKKAAFEEILAEAAGGEILGQDLYLYPRMDAALWGSEEEFISSALWMTCNVSGAAPRASGMPRKAPAFRF